MTRRARLILGGLAAAVVVAGAAAAGAATGDAVRPAPSVAQSGGVMVARVVDGDTVVAPAGHTVRIVGLNTPETVAPSQRRGAPPDCMGPEASARAHQLLDGQTVRLDPDPTQAAVDRYGRELRVLRLADGRDYAEVMVREGFARAYKVSGPAPTNWPALLRAQAAARTAGTGVWRCPAR